MSNNVNASLSGQTVAAVWPPMRMSVFGAGEEGGDTSTHVTSDQIKGVLLARLPLEEGHMIPAVVGSANKGRVMSWPQ